jgi:hypothetical protein
MSGPHQIDRDRLRRAAEATGCYPGCIAYRDLLKIVQLYEALTDPPPPEAARENVA